MVSSNVFHDVEIGIDINISSINAVWNNSISRTVWGSLIERGGPRNVFTENHVFDSIVGVVVFDMSDNNLIHGNKIEIVSGFTSNGLRPLSGVSLGTNSSKNIVDHNEIRGFARGVNMGAAFDSNITMNVIEATEVGVLLRFRSAWNRITGNLIEAPVGISICSSFPNLFAPPPNDLKATDKSIEHCKK